MPGAAALQATDRTSEVRTEYLLTGQQMGPTIKLNYSYHPDSNFALFSRDVLSTIVEMPYYSSLYELSPFTLMCHVPVFSRP